MAGQVDNRRRGWIRAQADIDTNGITDGANMTACDFDVLEFPINQREKLERPVASGENEPDQKIRGGSMAEITVQFAHRGLNQAVDVGEDAATIHATPDFRALIYDNAFATQEATVGDQLVSAAAAVVTTVAVAYDVEQLLPLWEDAAKTPDGVEWLRAEAVAAFAHTVDRSVAGTYTAAGQVWGSLQWTKPDRPSDQGAYLGMVVEIDAKFWVLTGGRVSSIKLTGPTRGLLSWAVTIKFKLYETQSQNAAYTLGNLPNHLPEPQGELKGLSACILFNSVEYDYKDFELDFGVDQVVVMSGCDPEGIQEIWNKAFSPVLTFNPLYSDSVWDEGNDALTKGELLVSLGAGVLDVAADVVNTTAIWFEEGQIDDAPLQSDNEIFRNGVVIRATKPLYKGDFTGGERGELFRMASA